MKVLHLTDKFYRFGGGEIFFRDLLNHLDPRVEFMCSLVTSQDVESDIDFPIPVMDINQVDLDPLIKECDLLLWWGRVGENIHKFDGVANKVMFAHSSHNVDWFLHIAAEKTNYAIAVSQEAKDKINFPKCWVVYPGISSWLSNHGFERNQLRSLFGFSPDDFVVGQFCRLESFKNVEATVRGLADTQAKLFLIGDGSQLELIANLCHQLLPRRFKHISYIPPKNMGAFYEAADAICISSKGEGCPRAMWETLQFKKPLICTRVGAMAELIDNGHTGLFVNDEADIGQAVTKLMDDSSLCQSLSEKGHQKFLTEGAIQATSTAIADIFEKIVKGIPHL